MREIVAAIEQRGSVNVTRLTVIEKWFEVLSRLSSFAIFIANHASRQKAKTTKQAGELIHEARTLLADVDVFAPTFRARRPQDCVSLFTLSKTSIGIYLGGRCASFVITTYS